MNENELIGIWVSSDNGAKLCLNKNGIFTIEGFDPIYWDWHSPFDWRYDEKFSSSIDGKGIWKMAYQDKVYFIVLLFEVISINEVLQEEAKISGSSVSLLRLEIAGKHGFCKKKPSIYLYKSKHGDPDGYRYGFYYKADK